MRHINGHDGKYAWTVKIGEKGQFVIPKEARNIFDIKPGDTIIVLADKKKGIAIPPKSMFTGLASTIFDGEIPEDKKEQE
jgi:AbrB family looped-hinge helix DNA binding protein